MKNILFCFNCGFEDFCEDYEDMCPECGSAHVHICEIKGE